MVNLKVEPRALKKMLKTCMPFSEQQVFPIKFSKEKVQVNYACGKLMVLAEFYPLYFRKYKCSQDELLIITEHTIKELNYGFYSEYLDFWTDTKGIHVEGDENSDKVCFHFIEPQETAKKPLVQLMVNYQNLLMPTKNENTFPLNVCAIVSARELRRPYSGGKKAILPISWDGESLHTHKLRPFNHGKYELSVEKFAFTGEPVIGYFKYHNFSDLAKQFRGQVWLGLGKKGLSLSQTTHTSKLTYILFADKVEVD